MRSRTSSRQIVLWHTMLVSVCFALGGSLLNAGDLEKHSPFLPPGWGEKKDTPPPPTPPPPAPVIARQLEFKGLIDLGGTTRFSIFDKKSGKSYWLTLDQMQDDFQVVRYNKSKQSVTVRAGGRTEEIELVSSDGLPMQITGAVAPSVSAPTASNPSPTVQATSGSTRRAPVVPRRRIVRPSNNQSPPATQQPITGTPATPLPTPPAS